MNICMYVLYAYIRVCMHLCVYACMYICMHVRIHVYRYIILKLGFEQYGWNCPSWEGELSGGIVRWNCPGELPGEVVRGNCPGELPGGNYPGGIVRRKCPFPARYT